MNEHQHRVLAELRAEFQGLMAEIKVEPFWTGVVGSLCWIHLRLSGMSGFEAKGILTPNGLIIWGSAPPAPRDPTWPTR